MPIRKIITCGTCAYEEDCGPDDKDRCISQDYTYYEEAEDNNEEQDDN